MCKGDFLIHLVKAYKPRRWKNTFEALIFVNKLMSEGRILLRCLSHSYYMSMALDLAKKASPLVLPNPRVGCVIVKNGTIIGKGYHQKYGEKHAEVLAIEDAIKNGYLLKNATMYVSLEPCCHFGKQPPCTEAIIKSGIKKVVVATRDPNPLVNGKGIQILKQHGIEVVEGVLQKEAESINKDFFKYMKTGTPYIAIKVAQSIDGKIATPSNKRFLFSTEEENVFVHSLRQKYMATLVSVNTVISDNPIVNYHPSLEVEASCFIDQTCYRETPSSRGPISTGVNSGSPYPTDYLYMQFYYIKLLTTTTWLSSMIVFD